MNNVTSTTLTLKVINDKMLIIPDFTVPPVSHGEGSKH